MSSSENRRRQSKRYSVSWVSRILLPGKRVIAVKVKDVSTGGLGFEADEQLSKGQEISIEFSPWFQGRQYVIRAKGVVTYSMIRSGSTGFVYGIKFTAIARDQFDTLTDILKRF